MSESRLKIIIDLEARGQEALGQIDRDMRGLGEAGEQGAGGLGGLGGAFEMITGSSLSAAGAFGAVAGAVSYAIGEAMQAEQVMAQTEAVIRATGGAAGLTAEEVTDMAGAFSETTGVGDETIQTGQNMLLTFKNIGEDTFPNATASMLDMAVAMNGGSLAGIDLKGTAIQLGKALNDPVEGMSALSRVGVTFTDAQKKAVAEMMKLNDVAGAQAIILAELESEFGGAAVAAGETTAGAFARLQNAAGNLAESFGAELIPVLADAADAGTLLITMNDRTTAAYTEHETAVTQTAQSYDEYLTEVTRAASEVTNLFGVQLLLNDSDRERILALVDLRERYGEVTEAQVESLVASGQLTDEQGYLLLAYLQNKDALDAEIAALGFATEAQFEQEQAVHDAAISTAAYSARLTGLAASYAIQTEATVDAKTALGNLKTIMGAAVDNEMERYRAKQEELRAKMSEYTDKITELQSKKYLTQAQKDELAETQGLLTDMKTAYDQEAAAHEERTHRILFDLLQQKLGQNELKDATSEYTAEEAAALNALAQEWGLKGELTATAIRGVDQAIADASVSGTLNMAVLTQAMTGTFQQVEGYAVPVVHNFTDSLIAAEAAMAGSTMGAGNLTTAVGNIPNRNVIIETYGVDDSISGAQNVKGAVDRLTDKTVDISTSGVGGAISQMDDLRGRVEAVPARTITVTVHTNYSHSGTPGPGGHVYYAAGGPIAAGDRGIWNENPLTRPETFVASQSGYILTRQEAQAALAAGVAARGGGVSGGGDQVTINNPMAGALYLESRRREAQARAEALM